MLTVVDYGMGNLGSIVNMFRKIGVQTMVAVDPAGIERADKLLLPGVGAFDTAMARIEQQGLQELLNHKALVEKVPILGICLGMQLLTESSEEGTRPGLGWIPARTLAFKGRLDTMRYKVPHMGWNTVETHSESPLTAGFESFEEPRFYFVHSYFVKCDDDRHSILQTTYGLRFDSVIRNGNIYGAQFHPEKSHTFGMQLFRNFARL
jgi:imidazole glycerol-phosphate synthase subunit HisH